MNVGDTIQGRPPQLQFRLRLRWQRVACLLMLILIASIVSAGCRSLELDLRPPGTIGMQRERAVIHDPYPSVDLGPPIVGGRPAGYDLPLAPAKALQVNPHAGNAFSRNRGAFVQPYTGF